MAISPTLTPNLRLRLTQDLTADAKYNLRRIDDLGSRFVVGQDGSTYVRAINDVYIEPESPDVGGTGVNGTLTIGDNGRSPADYIDVEAWARSFLLSSPLSLLDQAAGGVNYLKIQYNSDADGGGTDSGGDRTLQVDMQGANRDLILGGNLILGGDYTLDVTAPGDSLTHTVDGDRAITQSGDLIVEAGDMVLNPSGGLRTITMTADATIGTATTFAGGSSLLITTTGARSLNAVVDGDLVTATGSQVLTNKTIDADNNTITDLANANIKAAAGIELDKLEALPGSEVVVTDGSGFMVGSGISTTTLGYLANVTSDIQAQIDSKANRNLNNLQVTGFVAGSLLIGTGAGVAGNLNIGPFGSVLRSDGTTADWDYPVGTGDVVGNGASTDNAIARYDGLTGKVIQSSVALLSDTGALSDLESVSFLENGNSVTVSAPAGLAASYSVSLPADNGTSGYFLQTNGAGATTWAEVPDPSLQESYGGGNTIDTTGGSPVEIFKSDAGGRALYVHHDAGVAGPGGAALLVERYAASGYALSVGAGDNNPMTVYQAPTAADANIAVEIVRDVGFSSVNPIVQVLGPDGDTQLQLTDGTSTANFILSTTSQVLTVNTADAGPAANSLGITLKSGTATDTGTNSGTVSFYSGDAMNGGQSGDATVSTGFQFGNGTTGSVGINTGFNFGTGGTGSISLSTGSTTTSGTSGSISLITGNPDAAGASGTVNIATGDGFAGGDTGAINITTGFTAAPDTVGSINLIAGNSIAGGTGGNIALFAAQRDSASVGQAGAITLITGESINAGNGGAFTVQAGGAANAGQGGGISLAAGNASGSGAAGSVSITGGMSNSGAPGDISLNPGVDSGGTPGRIMTAGPIQVNGSSASPFGIRFLENGAPFTDYVELVAPSSLGGNVVLTLPPTDGDTDDLLGSNGSGVTTWRSVAATQYRTAVSSDVTLTNRTIHLVDTSAARSLALPAPSSGMYIVVKDAAGTGAATNNITITRPGGQTIDAVAASYVMNSTRQSITIVSDGTNYFIL